MLDLRPARWFEEMEAARTYRDQFLDDWADAIARFHGPTHRSGGSASATTHDPENHAFEWTSLMVPRLTASNPRARVKTSRAGPARRSAMALQYALNRWIELVGMQTTNEQLATDFGLKWAVSAVFPQPMPGMSHAGDVKRWPCQRRLSPRRYLYDPLAVDRPSQRWRAHLVIEDKQDLLERARKNPKAGWNIKEIEALPAGIGVEEARGERDGQHAPGQRTLERGEIAYMVFWVPEIQPNPKLGADRGFNGGLLTLGIGSAYDTGNKDSAAWLRKPIPYYGPRWGPYNVCGGYVVPDDSTPLAPISATAAQAEHLNSIARAIQTSIEGYKRIALVSDGDPDLQVTVSEGTHGYVYTTTVDDVARNVVQLELGGLTQQFLAAEERARQSLDRNTGLPDAMRGNVQGGATATEVDAAMAGGGVRVGHHMDKFRNFLSQDLRTVAWYLEHDSSIQTFALGPEAARAISDEFGTPMEEAWFSPGLAPGQDYDDFDDMDFQIELYSMERTSEQQQAMQAAELDQMVVQMGPMMSNPMMQHIRWEDFLQKRGELRGINDYARMFDLQLARKLAAKAMNSSVMQPSGNGMLPQPRLPFDIGGGAPRTTQSGINGLNHAEPQRTLPSRDLGRSQPETTS